MLQRNNQDNPTTYRAIIPQVDEEEGVESVHLPCRATGHLSEDVTVEWTRVDIWITKVHVFHSGSDQLEEQNQKYRCRTEMKKDLLETGDLSLTLKSPTDRDNNCYTCTVYSGEGNILMQQQVKIRVKVCQLEAEEGERFVLLPFRTTPDLPEDAQVNWWRYDPEPPMTVLKCQNGCEQKDQQDQFYRGRTEIPNDHLKAGDISLTLKYPTDRDTGRYICSVTSTTVSRKKTVLLKVINRQMEVEEGAESVQLPFITTAGLPKDTRVEWIRYEPRHMKVHVYQNGSEHPEDQNPIFTDRTEMNEDPLESGDLTLTLKQPTVGDSGTYRCEVCSREEKCRRETTVVVRVRQRIRDQPDDLGMEGLPLIQVR
ncbi:uncharacterized protein LOC133420437 [Cololabis saira]|uniref:uncharacterized protein LOC133420437 n=1 Tax=Cololabis saira TaxID=129043 RepID=UPI002AD3CD0B|nr:uncharacterized protein LOC133420437 [Cololabis saira]